VNTERQRATLAELLDHAGQLPDVTAVILIGSLAAGTADTMSDVDAIVVVDQSSFAASHRARHCLHRAVAACWDHPGAQPADLAAHKWIDQRGVMVEVLIGTRRSLRVAEPARVVLGDPTLLTRMQRRPAIARTDMTVEAHPIEAAYDGLKAAVRQTR
jgi:predicted nucleotidyltransferase